MWPQPILMRFTDPAFAVKPGTDLLGGLASVDGGGLVLPSAVEYR